ncbi:hypothetical protein V1477_008252 [Vespula maculifrons]|uniref:Uncharacterized protein n=1 Tax=Vespula maculifrons TaxID=7453 RepID=A0ABD2CCH4_VESMC
MDTLRITKTKRAKDDKALLIKLKENFNENHNAFDTGRLKTDNARTKTKDRALGQCKKELKMTKPC